MFMQDEAVEDRPLAAEEVELGEVEWLKERNACLDLRNLYPRALVPTGREVVGLEASR
jgi:hypothetical protein